MNIRNRRFYLIRHANALPCENDHFRQISPKGREQAHQLVEAIKNKTPGEIDLCLCSPALRAYDTACELTGFRKNNLVALDELYKLADQKGDERLIDLLKEVRGVKGIRPYLEHRNSTTLHRFGATAADKIEEKLEQAYDVKTVMVVSHSVLLNIIGFYLFPVQAVRDLLLDFDFSECGAVEVIVGDSINDISVNVVHN